MFRASEKASNESTQIIMNVLKEKGLPAEGEQAVYAYAIKNGLIRKKLYNYAVSFNPTTKVIKLVGIDASDNAYYPVL